MHAAKAAYNHLVFDDHMAGNGGGIYNDDPISQTCVMGNVAARHQQTIIANRGDTAASLSAQIDGHMLSDGIAFADLEL